MNLVTAARLLGIGLTVRPGQGSSPAVSREPGQLDVFAAGPDGELQHKWFGP